jgi:DNA-binding transcriptional LysR family regulator
MLDVKLLQTFREVAMRGSFSLAAEELGFTQPAISQHLARLERHLGVKVLERTARGVKLTPAGEALLAETETVLSSVRQAERAAKAAGGVVASRLRVGAFPSAAAGLVPGAVREARRLGGRAGFPDIELDLQVMEPEPALRALVRGRVDIALMIQSPLDPVVVPDGIELLEVTDDPMMIALPPDHSMASRHNVDLSELAEEPFLLTELGGTCADSNILLRACRDAGFAPNVRLESEDYNALQGMAAAGLGISIVPRMATIGAHPGVVLRPLKPPAPSRTILAAVSKERDPLVDAFVESLQAAGDELDGKARLTVVA